MKRLIIRWTALAVFLILLAMLFIRLGEWQLDRLDQRRDRNQAVIVNEDQPAVSYRELMGQPVAENLQWRLVEVTGTYTGEQYQVRYRSFNESPGTEVAAVLRTTQGDELLVNRGFIPRPQGQADSDVLPSPPVGEVRLTGYLRRDELGEDTATVPHDFKVRLINAGRIGASLGRPLLPGYVSLISSVPPNGEGLQPLTPPPLNEGNHFSYALQWFSFSVIALVGIVFLIRTDLKDRQKARERAARRRARARAQRDAAAMDTSGATAAPDES